MRDFAPPPLSIMILLISFGLVCLGLKGIGNPPTGEQLLTVHNLIDQPNSDRIGFDVLARPVETAAAHMISERSLFSEMRRPYHKPEVQAAELPAPPRPLRENRPRPPIPDFRLAGIISVDGENLALVDVNGSAAEIWLREGDLIGGWTVVEVEQDHIKIVHEEEVMVVKLYN